MNGKDCGREELVREEGLEREKRGSNDWRGGGRQSEEQGTQGKRERKGGELDVRRE